MKRTWTKGCLWGAALLLLLGVGACGSQSETPSDGDRDTYESGDDRDSEASDEPGTCHLDRADTDPDSTPEIGCRADYDAVAAPPQVESIPGTLSAKTVIDQMDGNALYFQNSRRYPIHWNFASTHLSGNGLPIVPAMGQFNQTEYYSPDRRFILGALNYYEGPHVWTYEIAPYDTASADMIATAFRLIKSKLWVGAKLTFHPTSDNVTREAANLPKDIPIITTDDLFKGITYQPLNLATAMGQLRFFSTDDLKTKYLSFRDIAVLQTIPNDISVCLGTITEQFQTPLSHINVLAQNRGTPNMGLKAAFSDKELRKFEGKWVELTVGAEHYTVKEITKEQADTWWNAHRPAAVSVPKADLSVTDLTDVEKVLDVDGLGLAGALAKAIPAFGGKASHFSSFPHIKEMTIPYPKAFVIPIYYYDQFMKQNGFDKRVDTMLADKDFQNDPAKREAMLESLRNDMRAAPVDAAFTAKLTAKLNADFPGVRMKFRSSTNCEDLNGFTGAGLYESGVGDPNDSKKGYLWALKKVWASVWRFRAFEEREYRSISHKEVGMAVLVHRSFPAEDANGVAITANIFDPKGLEPGHYVNVQKGDTSVVLPPDDTTTSDQFVYYYDMQGQPVVYLFHSSLVAAGSTVLTRAQIEELSRALSAIHSFFNPIYGPNTADHFFAMDVEFKFDTETGDSSKTSKLVIKQARPYPGRGQGE